MRYGSRTWRRGLSFALLVAAAWTASGALATAADTQAPAAQRFAADTQETPSFQRHVLPLMGRLGCNGRACHGSFQGQGGLRLSLFGYDFKMDHDALAAGDEPRIDLKKPAESLMLMKPTGTDDDHGGGHRLDVGSWQYRVLLRWIESGAKPVDEAKDAQFVRMEVTPREIVFPVDGAAAPVQLTAIAHWSDGAVEDVTCLCRYQTNDESIATVDESGKITSVGPGDTHIVAFYDNGVVPVAVLRPVTDKVGPNYPSVPTPTKIDDLVVTKLRKLGIVPSDVCTDAEFLRRASLDVTGQLPTAQEIEKFLADSSPDKRARKIDELLDRPAYSAWWATKLSDILGNNEYQLRRNDAIGEPSVQWYDWLERRLSENVAYDDLVQGIVLAVSRTSPNESFSEYCRQMAAYVLDKDGHDYAERETMPHYWARRNMRTANEKALSFSYAFLGVRLQCAECHKHPFDQWSQQDFQQFTAFFDRVSFGAKDRDEYQDLMEQRGITKKMGAGDRYRVLAAAAKKGEMIPFEEVYVAPGKRTRSESSEKKKERVTGRVITPKVLGGEEVVETNYDDPREPLMDWLRDPENPYFARSIVNRVWASYFNVGIVEPADDMNLANPPSNRELLDWLAAEFVAHDFDLKWLHRTILGSRTYQLSWQTNSTNELDLRNFSRAVPRRMPAEVVLDAVTAATAGQDELARRAADPVSECSIGLARGYTQRTPNNYALAVFGKPKRETPCDCERSNEPSLLQTVFLRNDQEMFDLILRGSGWVKTASAAINGTTPELDGRTKAKISELSKLDDQRERLESQLKKAKTKDKDSKTVAKAQKELSRLTERADELRAEIKQAQPAKPASMSLSQAVREAYLRTFSRLPSEEEQTRAEQYVRESESTSAGLRDLIWALANSKEFVVNH